MTPEERIAQLEAENAALHELVRALMTRVRCPTCQAMNLGTFPAQVPSRVQYGSRLRAWVVYLVEQQLVPYGRVCELFADLFDIQLSRGTLVSWVQQGAAALEPMEAALKAALHQVSVLHSDETACGRRGNWPGRMSPAPTG